MTECPEPHAGNLEDQPPCARCVHYFLTWDRRRPHGCRAMGFKSPGPPSWVVYESSGQACRLYQSRPAAPEA